MLSAVESFGFLAVSVMVVAYAREDRSTNYILLFGFACFAATLYAVLIRSWPFAAVEFVWGIVALRRWRLRSRRVNPQRGSP